MVEPEPGIGLIECFQAYGLSSLRAGCMPVRRVERAADGAGTPLRLAIPEIEYVVTCSGRRHPDEPARERAVAMDAALHNVQRPLSLLVHVSAAQRSFDPIPITILPPWNWSLGAESRTHVACYVVAGHAALIDLATAVRSAAASGAAAQCRVAYESVTNRSVLLYEPPQVQHEPWSGATHQALRPPSDILGVDRARATSANCIDLALLFAGAFEAAGMAPLLIFTGETNESFTHCLPAVWSTPGRRFRPLLSQSDLVARVAGGDLVVFEGTGVCGAAHALDFAAASERGVHTLRESRSAHAIDVSAVRPPTGRCSPMVLAYAPAVAQALATAQTWAEGRGAKRRETTHLLYGLCVARGDVTTWLLERMRSDGPRVLAAIEASAPAAAATAVAAVATRNHETCLGAARANARDRGSVSVEEEDLWWALLETPSASLRRVLAAAGCTLSRLQRELGTRFDRPGWTTTRR
jgi:hypothetical protein